MLPVTLFVERLNMNHDSWCKPILSRHGNRVSGGAARNVRIADLGGMDEIIAIVARPTLELSNAAAVKRSRAQIRLVSNG